MAFLERSDTVAVDPVKGRASYFDIVVAESGLIRDAGWSFETPTPGAARIAEHIAFHGHKVTLEQV